MINVALLGFGRIGQMHAQNIYLNKTLNLLYVYEKIDKLRKKAKNLYNCKIEKDYKKIFSDKKVDIIFISSPTNTHIRFIEEGIKYDKTIFCEKPLDLNINKIVKTFKNSTNFPLSGFKPHILYMILPLIQGKSTANGSSADNLENK